MEIGSIAEWVGALTGSGIATASLIVALRANRYASEANNRAAKMEEVERQRDILNIGSQLQVWWAYHDANRINHRGHKKDSDSPKEWGIVIANTGDQALILTKVEITVSRKNNFISPSEPQSTTKTDKYYFEIIPPGRFFKNVDNPQEYTKTATDINEYKALVDARAYRVKSIKYSTPNHRRWEWTPETGLLEIPET